MPFCCALAIECHQRRSDLPLRQVDSIYRTLEPRPAVHFALEFSRGKTVSKCELGSNNTLLRVKRKQSLQFLLFCLVYKGILHLGLGFFVFCFFKTCTKQEDLTLNRFPGKWKEHFHLLCLSWEGTGKCPAACSSPISTSSPFLAMRSCLGFALQPTFRKTSSSVPDPFLTHCSWVSSARAPRPRETRPKSN